MSADIQVSEDPGLGEKFMLFLFWHFSKFNEKELEAEGERRSALPSAGSSHTYGCHSDPCSAKNREEVHK